MVGVVGWVCRIDDRVEGATESFGVRQDLLTYRRTIGLTLRND